MCCALPFFCAAAVTTLCCASDGAVRYYHCRGAADDRLMLALSLLVLCPPGASLSPSSLAVRLGCRCGSRLQVGRPTSVLSAPTAAKQIGP